jgi:hypothetical protein
MIRSFENLGVSSKLPPVVGPSENEMTKRNSEAKHHIIPAASQFSLVLVLSLWHPPNSTSRQPEAHLSQEDCRM